MDKKSPRPLVLFGIKGQTFSCFFITTEGVYLKIIRPLKGMSNQWDVSNSIKRKLKFKAWAVLINVL